MNAAVTAPVTTAQEFNTVQFQKRETSLCDDFFFFSFKEEKYSTLSMLIFHFSLFFFFPFCKGRETEARFYRQILG